MGDGGHIHINLFGPFEASNAAGQPVVVASKRSKALLAALATGQKQRRSRAWLQDLLWHGRAPAQASASLRQELRSLRKVFGVSDLILCEEHGVLQLNAQRVTVIGDAVPADGAAGDFLEGLQLPNPFQTWVDGQRQKLAQGWPSSGGVTPLNIRETPDDAPVEPIGELASGPCEPILYINRQSSAEIELEVANEVFQDHIEKGLVDLAPIDVRHLANDTERDAQTDRHTLLKTQLVKAGHEALLRVALQAPVPEVRSWSARWTGPRAALLQCDEGEVMQLAFRAQEAAIDALSACCGRQNRMSASLYAFRALQSVFTMDREALMQADRDFQKAYEYVPKGVFKAWRGFIQANLIVENTDLDAEAQAELAASLVREALRDEPENAALKAAAAHVFLLTGQDVLAAGELARDATALNPANPLAWASRANAAIAAGQADSSVEYSNRALTIGRHSKSRHWWEMQAGVSAALAGNLKAARDHSLIAHSLLPSFRPPLRYLAALESKAGNTDASDVFVQKMQDFETGFDVQTLSEPEYPSGNLRRAGLA